MSKKSLLYVSPFPPQKSGIADYSEKLVSLLSSKFDITLCIDDYEICSSLKEKFPVFKYTIDNINFKKYDYILYNFGNNGEYHSYMYDMCLKHPGFIILHDYVLFCLFFDFYNKKNNLYSKLYENISIKEFLSVKQMIKKRSTDINLMSRIPLNDEILKSENKFLVHSWYSYNKILETGFKKEDSVFKFTHVNLLNSCADFTPSICKINREKISKKDLYKKYDIPQDATVIASFGCIIQTKLNDAVCEVVAKLSKTINKKFCFVLVGEGEAVDNYLTENLIIKTGYTSIEEFESFIEYVDIIVNLRYPSMGETSGAMIRILQRGKVCIINPDAWFAEIPSDCVYKVNRENLSNDLEKGLLEILNNKNLCEKISTNAKKYIETEYNDKKIVDDFCKIVGL